MVLQGTPTVGDTISLSVPMTLNLTCRRNHGQDQGTQACKVIRRDRQSRIKIDYFAALVFNTSDIAIA